MNPRNTQILEAVRGGASYDETAAKLGVTRNVVAGVCYRAGIGIGTGGFCGRKGEKNPSAKLNSSDVIEIRRRYKFGNGNQLASEFGVTLRSILNVAHGDTWKHLT